MQKDITLKEVQQLEKLLEKLIDHCDMDNMEVVHAVQNLQKKMANAQ